MTGPRVHLRLALAAAFLLAAAEPARAEYLVQTIPLTQSNRLADGVVYGSYTVEAYDGKGDPGGGLEAGQVRLTITADLLASYGKVKDFGIDRVGFNTDLDLTASQIDGPAGWQVKKGGHFQGFGSFDWRVRGTPKTAFDPVVITIRGLGLDATPDHFLVLSSGRKGRVPREGPSYVAARVGHLKGAPPRHTIGGAVAAVHAPAPPALVLALLGVAGIGAARLRSRGGW